MKLLDHENGGGSDHRFGFFGNSFDDGHNYARGDAEVVAEMRGVTAGGGNPASSAI